MQKCVLFEISHFFIILWDFIKFLRWNSDHFQIEFLCFLWDKWTILRLFYLMVYCAIMCTFWGIALFYHFIGLSKFLRWNSDHFPIEYLCFCMWSIDHSKTCLLRGAHCKNEYFLRYCTDLLWDLATFSRSNSDFFQIKFLQFLWGKWIILRLFYWGVCYVKMFTFWDITLFYHFMGPSQFLRWNQDQFQI